MPSLNVILNGNAAPLARELRRVQGLTTSFAGNIKSMLIGFVGIATVGEAFRKTVSTAEELVQTSMRLGLGVEQLQILRRAAEDNNVEFSKLAGAFEKLDIARAKALGGGSGSDKLVNSFRLLGISAGDLKNQTSANLFQNQIASTIKISNPEMIAAPLKDIFGKAFGSLVPVLNTDFDALGKKMRQMGALMDATSAVELKHLKNEFSFLSNIIVTQLAPAMLQFADMVIGSIGKVRAAGSFWGTVYQNMKNETPDSVPKNILGPAGFDGKPRINFWKDIWYNVFGEGNKPATAAAIGADNEWKGYIAEQKAKLAKMADDLNHPVAPTFNDLVDRNKKDKERFKFLGGDLTENQKSGAYALPGAVTLVDINRSMDRKLGQLATAADEINAKLDSDPDNEENY